MTLPVRVVPAEAQFGLPPKHNIPPHSTLTNLLSLLSVSQLQAENVCSVQIATYVADYLRRQAGHISWGSAGHSFVGAVVGEILSSCLVL